MSCKIHEVITSHIDLKTKEASNKNVNVEASPYETKIINGEGDSGDKKITTSHVSFNTLKTVNETRTVVFDDNVTTSDMGPITPVGLAHVSLDAQVIIVTFDGAEYRVDKTEVDIGNMVAPIYGNIDMSTEQIDFSNYPFLIMSILIENTLEIFTETAGTYSFKIETVESSAVSSSNLSKNLNLEAVIDYTSIIKTEDV